jgi:uncharacterized protein with GYD domain
MATYVVLLNWTEQGVKHVKDSVDRSHQANEMFKPLGVKLTQIYWTAGRYDIVSVVEAPDDQAMSAAMLKLAGLGNLRTETLRAFDEQGMRQILQKLG